MTHLAHATARVLVVRFAAAAAMVAIAATTSSPRLARAANAPAGFSIESVIPDVGFNNPVGLAFTPDGRLFVAEKRGVVRVVANGVKLLTPLWNGEAEVLNQGDRGLLGITVDPNYARNHYVYFLYTVDPDSNNVDTDNDAFGRLVRYRTSAADSNVVDPGSRTVLIGATWREGFPSGSSTHAIGALRWGADGSLLASCGDGGQYGAADAGGKDSALFVPGRTDPAQDIGAYRAQMLESLAGKLLRVNPENGHGYPSNPYADGDLASNRSRIWCYGLRNPYRFAVRPGTGSPDASAGDPGSLYIGDVGWKTWEEIDISPRGGENFGWPCYEGPYLQPQYAVKIPPHHGCSTMGTAENPATHTPPVIAMHPTVADTGAAPGPTGRCTVGGMFYDGDAYPSAYRHRYFFAEFEYGWIKVATFDWDNRLVEITPFADECDGPVDLVADPVTGDLYFAAVYTGVVYRIRYTGTPEPNGAPSACAKATPDAGPAPLLVNLSCAGTRDPDNDRFTVSWDFGDGTSSETAEPVHAYPTPGRYAAVLTATDAHGGVARDTAWIEVRESLGVLGHPRSGACDSVWAEAADPSAPDDGPRVLCLGRPYPNPTAGSVMLALELPRAAPVRFAVHDLMGRAVWSDGERLLRPGRWTLNWNGSGDHANRVHPGLYVARITIDGAVFNRRLAIVR